MTGQESDLEVGIAIGSFSLCLVLGYLKAYYHFQYLKAEQGYFEEVEFVSLVANPFKSLNYFPELFIIFNFPILWNLKKHPYRYKAGIFTYLSLVFLVFAIIYWSC